MAKIKIKLTVDDEAIKRLSAAIDQAVTTGLLKGAYEVERQAKIFSPVDTGTLRRSIKTENVKKNNNKYSIAVSPSVAYAEFVERPGPVRRTGQRPFLAPALVQAFPRIINHISNELRRIG